MKTLFSAFIALGVTLSAQATDKLYVYNWTEYVPSSLLAQFTEETGIEVIYSTFESNEEMYSKLKLTQGTSGYDIVFPSSYYVSKMAKEGMLEKLDKTKLTNFKYVSKELMGQSFDPKNEYSLPYIFGLTGIGVNKAEIDPAKVTSWADLWKSEYKGLLQLTNDSREVFHMALLLDGKSPNTTNPEEIKTAYERLTSLIPNVLTFNSDAPEMPFLQGEVSIGMIWNGSAYLGKKEDPNLTFVYPKEGVIVWMDNYAIPKTAKNKAAAYKFIDFLLRPESAKVVIEKLGFSMPNEGVRELLTPEQLADKVLFPPKAELEKGISQADVGDAIEVYEKYWNKLRTSN
ncbi:extracellular solute-binding protein [Pasteurella skyensis]|uniref:Putrescine-binding periplasmic protein n=1 Tax=Phocoenobacter skyensis TaxID=97481 RepID=A0AAJ6NAL0_9PAST|nr:extracellular solute-binding protein [Pasteurella skyensis]MDP8162776.1 extracellular solute-binding protein [Pasteurella skyensis]MDP8173247.1 extracellular solute-binding protein [Pasteurella skyensis]MDP8177536.1 extracellular solute-binding protein [Pasteurella skyensis]MDP8178878.1 extracellular solute-binding protein [Pasteurella skyensis]MDP8183178.1 extracellular solute-binding protein [Pasteurella skyensis]